MFRTRSIFRTLLYSEPETYSEQCQTSAIIHVFKNSYLTHFLGPSSKNKTINILSCIIFRLMELYSSNIKKFLIFSQKKAFLRFRESEIPSSLYWRKPNYLIFEETETLKTFIMNKVKRSCSVRIWTTNIWCLYSKLYH